MKTETHILQTGELDTNSVVIARAGECALFDPSGDMERWVEWLAAYKLRPVAIYLTHGHFDHMMAVADLTVRFGIPWFMSDADRPIVAMNNTVGRLFGAPHMPKLVLSNAALPDSDNIEILPDVTAQIISTPGHTPGGVCFYFPSENILLSGDTLFADDLGRTDMPLGNSRKLMESIAKLHAMNLPDNTRVIPGHERETTIAALKTENEFWRTV